MRTSELIEDFAQFAREQVNRRGEELPLDELFEEWRLTHPPVEDWLAIQASLRDVENGVTGRSFEDFALQFRKENDLRDTE
jgi:hypothetical protein